MIKVILESSIDERKKEKLKENLKKCITLALKYDPKNQLAKDLMEKEQ
jgi:hypothetical protein